MSPLNAPFVLWGQKLTEFMGEEGEAAVLISFPSISSCLIEVQYSTRTFLWDSSDLDIGIKREIYFSIIHCTLYREPNEQQHH